MPFPTSPVGERRGRFPTEENPDQPPAFHAEPVRDFRTINKVYTNRFHIHHRGAIEPLRFEGDGADGVANSEGEVHIVQASLDRKLSAAMRGLGQSAVHLSRPE
jgi:hypothetical protein